MGIVLTRNQRYDQYTRSIILKTLSDGDIAVDVGCHKGEILDIMLKASPGAKHFCFEPIPAMHQALVSKYEGKAHFYPIALAAEKGTVTFNHVKNAPAYSGIKPRKYEVEPDIELVQVETDCLDHIVPETTTVSLIKIDVEGAEFGVLKGAASTIKRCKPVIIFEFGLGASDYYGTTPTAIYQLINHHYGMKIYRLASFANALKKGKTVRPEALTEKEFSSIYSANTEYVFVAA